VGLCRCGEVFSNTENTNHCQSSMGLRLNGGRDCAYLRVTVDVDVYSRKRESDGMPVPR